MSSANPEVRIIRYEGPPLQRLAPIDPVDGQCTECGHVHTNKTTRCDICFGPVKR